MSTRSNIARLNKDGSVDSVYCHWDGYPEYNGKMLVQYHNNQEDVDRIIELGDMSVLDKLLDPTADGHTFDRPEVDVSIFYGRDRGEENIEAKHFDTVTAWEDYICDGDSWIEFGYLWDGECWQYCSCCTGEYADIPD